MRLTRIESWRQDDSESLDALSRMDSNAADVSGTGRTGHQNAVWSQFEVRVFVCIVDIPDDLLWVKQDHEVMGEPPLRSHGNRACGH